MLWPHIIHYIKTVENGLTINLIYVMKFDIQMNYIASITTTVEAEDEGAALDKAREWAENADIGEYIIGDETKAIILNRYD